MMQLPDLLSGLDKCFWKKGRVETFEHWPFKPEDGVTCTPELMAAAGFHMIEAPDTVECFICAKQLDGWEASDDPWYEHGKHQAGCPYVILNKRDELQWTINDFFDLMKVYYVNSCTRQLDKEVKNLKIEAEKMARQIPKICKAARQSRKFQK